MRPDSMIELYFPLSRALLSIFRAYCPKGHLLAQMGSLFDKNSKNQPLFYVFLTLHHTSFSVICRYIKRPLTQPQLNTFQKPSTPPSKKSPSPPPAPSPSLLLPSSVALGDGKCVPSGPRPPAEPPRESGCVNATAWMQQREDGRVNAATTSVNAATCMWRSASWCLGAAA